MKKTNNLFISTISGSSWFVLNIDMNIYPQDSEGIAYYLEPV